MAQHETPRWLLPYPDSAETANVPRDLQALAQQVDPCLTQVATDSAPPVGAILLYAAELPPVHYMLCDGSSHARADFPELSDVLGSLYGGDATNFNLPDLMGRFPLGVGSGAGLTLRQAGDKGGEERHTLSAGELPNGTVYMTNPAGRSTASMELAAGAGSGRWAPVSQPTGPPGGQQGAYAQAGGGAHNTLAPFLCVVFVIRYH